MNLSRDFARGSLVSLCNLCVLYVSVVWFYSEFINHGDKRMVN